MTETNQGVLSNIAAVRDSFLGRSLWWETLGTPEGDQFAAHCATCANDAHARYVAGVSK